VLKGIPQKPVFKNVRDNDRKRVLAFVPADTVARYKKVYAELQSRLLSGSFRRETRESPDVHTFLAARGLGVSQPVAGHRPPLKPVAAFAGWDTVTHPVFARFMEAVKNRQLIEPRGQSAYDYYRQLEKENAEGELTLAANEKLFSALVSKTQKLIDSYIFGKLENQSQRAFDLAYQELQTARHLIEEDNPYRKVLAPKI